MMTHNRFLLAPAALAIATALAASSTPVMAQDATTTSVPTETSSVPAEAPAPVMTSEPMVQAVPITLPTVETAPETSPAPAVVPAARTAQPASARPASSAATQPVVDATPSPSPAIAPITPDFPAQGSIGPVAPVEAEPVAVAADSAEESGVMPELAIAGGLGLLALGSFALLATRRRRVPAEPSPSRLEPKRSMGLLAEGEVTRTDAKLATPTAAAAPAFFVAAPDVAVAPTERQAPLSRRVEPFAMPSGPVPTGAERRELIEGMVAAPPDARNPFKSAKARRRRARIMLASHEQRLREQARESFDFRTYRPSQAIDPQPKAETVVTN